MAISLQPITRQNIRDITRLHVADGQEHFVASNVMSLAQAYVEPGFVPLAIYNDAEPVGFLMHGRSDEVPGDWIIRLMIDAQHQGQGYARAALQQAIERIKAQPDCHEIMISYEPNNTAARTLYASLGFQETDEAWDGEVVARLALERSNADRSA